MLETKKGIKTRKFVSMCSSRLTYTLLQNSEATLKNNRMWFKKRFGPTNIFVQKSLFLKRIWSKIGLL